MLNDLLAKNQSSDKLYVEDVFSTYLYTGNITARSINNGIDLSGKGGMTWIKWRSGGPGYGNHEIYDTNRGATKAIDSSLTDAETTRSGGLTSFNSNGFSLGTFGYENGDGSNLVSWTFREAPKFFDVVTYTGNSANRTISHGLGSVPGMIIVKRTDTTGDWFVYHRSLSNTQYLRLNMTNQVATSTAAWNSTTPTSTEFSLGDSALNISGGSYVAYLFAHDTTADGVIQCGSYTGNGSTTGPVINLGYEPQYVLIKKSSAAGGWVIFDTMRGLPVGNYGSYLVCESSAAEVTNYVGLNVSATGFQPNQTDDYINGSGGTYIYMAIRRGPMRVPTDATKVYYPSATSATTSTVITTGFPVDTQIERTRSSVDSWIWTDRIRGINTNSTDASQKYLSSSSTAAEAGTTGMSLSYSNTGYAIGSAYSGVSMGYWNFRRAAGFFDVVCWSGTSADQTLNHNLTVPPELIIYKTRGTTSNWYTAYSFTNTTYGYSLLNLTSAPGAQAYSSGGPFSAQPTSTQFSVGQFYNTSTMVAYLFASCPGVSKVGSYTGTGTTLQINCGFTNGARFVLIKRTDSTGDWYVWDTARGIVAGNDPYLLLNSTAAEVTNTDYVDAYSAGFELSSTAPAALNANGGTYMYLAIA